MKFTPEKGDIEHYCNMLSGEGESLITFQFFDDTKRTKRAGFLTKPLEEALPILTELNQDGCGIYAMLNEGDGKGRSAVNVTKIRALAVDLDGAPVEPLYASSVTPHLITETSNGKFQGIFFIEPVTVEQLGGFEKAAEWFSKMQKSLARKFHGDESVSDLCRVFRIPGFWHHKHTPFQSRIVFAEQSLPYKMDRLIAALGLEEIIEKVSVEIREPLRDIEEVATEKIKIGDRHRTLLRYASKYAHVYRMNDRERWYLLQGLNNDLCHQPVPLDDLRRINVQAGRYAEEERARVESVDISALIEKHKIVSKADPDEMIPDYLFNPPGMVGDMMRYILSSSTKPQPELALGAAFVACGTVMGRKIQTETGLRSNPYFLSLIETGGGKDWPRQAIKKVFDAIGHPERACVEEVTSDTSILQALERCPSQAFLFDEFGRLLRSVSQPNAGAHLTSIITTFMKLYSSAAHPFYTKVFADNKQNKVIHQPNVCFLATTVERNFYSSITKESVEDGFLNRIIFLRSTEPDPQIREVTNFEPPESLLRQFETWEKIPYAEGNLGNLEGSQVVAPKPRIVPYAPGAKAVFSDMESDLRVYRKELRQDGLSGLFTRVYENALKIALILAAGENYEMPEISVNNAEYGSNFVLMTTKQLLSAVKREVSDSREEAKHNHVLNAIRDSGLDGISQWKLGEKTRKKGLDSKTRNAILKELVEAGTVQESIEPSAGRTPVKIFRYLGR